MKIRIDGQVKGGKNNVGITRSGKRYPKPEFALWRDQAVAQVRQQTRGMKPIDKPVTVIIHYFPGDRRRRDCPALLDGIWHVLERAGVVKDDTLLGGIGKCVLFYNMGVNKDPYVHIEIGE